MASYGFKVFRTSLAKQRGTKKQPWECPGWSYGGHLIAIGKKLHQEGRANPDGGLDIWPAPFPTDITPSDLDGFNSVPESAMGAEDPVGRMVSVVMRTPRRVEMIFKVGRVGGFDSATGKDAEDPTLRHKAATREYRAILLYGPDSEPGLLAVESIGRTTPNSALLNLLALGSKWISLDDGAGKDEPVPWWRMSARQVSDGVFLDELLKEDKVTLVLKMSRPNAAGDPSGTEITLEAKLAEAEVDRAHLWVRLMKKDRVERGMGGMVELLNISEELEGLDFDDGYVRIGDSKSSTKVKLADYSDKFIYPVNDHRRPTDEEWSGAVRDRFRVIEQALEW